MGIPRHRQLYLAIDQGGHASRAQVIDHSGEVLVQALCGIGTEHPKSTWIEHDAEEMIASLNQVISNVVSQLGIRKNRLVAAALACQRASVVCWHRGDGHPLSKVLSWQDRRARDCMKKFEPFTETIHAKTGLIPSPHYGASKLRWCLDHLPEVKTALNKGNLACGPLASFIAYRLTQAAVQTVDPANASRTLLWNIDSGDWDSELLDLFRIPLKALPQCVPTRHPFGMIQAFDRKIPLALVTGDQSAALFQCGPPQEDALYINLGSGAFLQRVLRKPAFHAKPLLTSVVLKDGNHTLYALEGTVHGAGSALSWFSREFGAEAWREQADTWLNTVQHPPIFINMIGGLGSPFWIPQMTPRFIGDGDIASRFTAVIESILFLIQANLEAMNRCTATPTHIILSGGIAQINELCQKLSNATERPVLRPQQCEATARGLAYLLMDSPRTFPGKQDSSTFFPRADKNLKNRYGTWKQAMAEVIASND
ncbi:MAG: FGGY family carbohydrate kinase [Nitrospiria bacterium]